MAKKSCWQCTKSVKFPGWGGDYYSPPEDPYCECTCELEITDEEWWELEDKYFGDEFYEKLAEICSNFDPIKCYQCGKEINVPKYKWDIWAAGWDLVPVCSEECKKEYKRIFEENDKEWL